MPARFTTCFALYKRYIDNGIGIWLSTDPTTWSNFKAWINSFGSLRWTFTEPSLQIDYLDITICFDLDYKLKTTLYEKQLNLYLFLHPPGGTPLFNMSTPHLGHPCGVSKMTIAYSRPHNLANLLCRRKLEHTPGPPVLAYLRRDSEGHFVCI
jgi:hypothetical protein